MDDASPDDAWLDAECRRLLDFGRRVVHPRGGAAWLDDDGAPDLGRPVHTWITSRTVHVYGIGALLGVDGAASTAAGALDGLRGVLRDPEHGGWFAAVGPDGEPDDTKSCYAHAFVMLAGSTAVVAGLPGADDLLAEATAGLRGALLGRRPRPRRRRVGPGLDRARRLPRPQLHDALARGDARGR